MTNICLSFYKMLKSMIISQYFFISYEFKKRKFLEIKKEANSLITAYDNANTLIH